MSKHKQFKDIQDLGEQEIYLSKLIKHQHDNELRSKWDSIIQNTGTPAIQQNKKNNFLKIISLIGLIAASVLLAYFLFSNNEIDPRHYAMQELNQSISHPGLTKGNLNETENRTSAIVNFNDQNFKDAILNFNKLAELTTEDRFYTAMAHLYSKEYLKAIQLLSPISQSETTLSQEAKWYLSLAYIMNNDNQKARTQLNRIKPNDWKYKEAQQLINNLN